MSALTFHRRPNGLRVAGEADRFQLIHKKGEEYTLVDTRTGTTYLHNTMQEVRKNAYVLARGLPKKDFDVLRAATASWPGKLEIIDLLRKISVVTADEAKYLLT